MGKKPLAGLVGLVTAGMLVTAGCGDCCHKNTRPSGDNYKPAPTFPKQSAKADKAAPGDPAPDKQASPPEPVKPSFETPAAMPTETKTGSQASATTPDVFSPKRQEVLSSPTTLSGFEKGVNVGSNSPTRPLMPAMPIARQNDVLPTAAPGMPNEMPTQPRGNESPEIRTPSGAPSRPASPLTAPPTPMPTAGTQAPPPPEMFSGPPSTQPGR
jgi:hypothetical protein